MYVITAKVSPYVETDKAVSCNPYWAGGSQWSDIVWDAVIFPNYEAAQRQVDLMNLREWTIVQVNTRFCGRSQTRVS